MADVQTDLLIVGAGPYGLALSAYAGHLGIDHITVGRAMDFWHAHMPDGMYLRSASDWHLDPLGVDTIEAYAARQEPDGCRDRTDLARAVPGLCGRGCRNRGIEPWADMVLGSIPGQKERFARKWQRRHDRRQAGCARHRVRRVQACSG